MLAIAAAGWFFDVFEGQIFNLTSGQLLARCAGLRAPMRRPSCCGAIAAGRVSGGRNDRRRAVRHAGRSVRPQVDDVGHDSVLFDLLGTDVLRDVAVAGCRAAVSGRDRRRRRMGRGRDAGCGGFSGLGAGSRVGHLSGDSILGTWLAALAGMAVGTQWRYAYLLGIVPALLVLWVRAKRAMSRPAGGRRNIRSASWGAFANCSATTELGRAAILGLLLAAVGLATFWGVTIAGQDLMQQLLRRSGRRSMRIASRRGTIRVRHCRDGRRWLGTAGFGPLAEWLGRRGAFAVMHERGRSDRCRLRVTCRGRRMQLLCVLPFFGFFTLGIHSGLRDLFSRSLFPSRLRATGSGVCFNGGRLAAAPMLWLSGDLKSELGLHGAVTAVGSLFLLGLVLLMFLPETKGKPLPRGGWMRVGARETVGTLRGRSDVRCRDELVKPAGVPHPSSWCFHETARHSLSISQPCSFLVASTATTLSAASWARAAGSNSRIGVAMVGCGIRGHEVMSRILATERAELRCLCDVYDEHRGQGPRIAGGWAIALRDGAIEEALRASGRRCRLARRPRSSARHARRDGAQGEQASVSRKADRPSSRGARGTDRGGQGAKRRAAVRHAATQRRHYQEAKAEIVDKGKLGQVLFVRGVWHDFPRQRRAFKSIPKPAGLDWERFLGPAPKRPFEWMRYDSWRLFPDYGGGQLSDILTHWVDVAQWFMNEPRPLDAVASGGIYRLNDGRENPDTVSAILRYPKHWNFNFECTLLPIPGVRPHVAFYGTEGTLEISRTNYIFRAARKHAIEVKAAENLDTAARDQLGRRDCGVGVCECEPRSGFKRVRRRAPRAGRLLERQTRPIRREGEDLEDEG